MDGRTSRRGLIGGRLRTAIDSNVISALWTGEPSPFNCKAALDDARRRGVLIICAPVYCELHACPGITPAAIQAFLRDTSTVVDFHIADNVWDEAAARFARYANRRRRSGGGSPKRMLVDFIVGAHALAHADGLLTLDHGRYRRDFPELKLL